MKHISYFEELNNHRILEQSSNKSDKNIDINQIVYGNAPIEFKDIIEDKNDPIRNGLKRRV